MLRVSLTSPEQKHRVEVMRFYDCVIRDESGNFQLASQASGECSKLPALVFHEAFDGDTGDSKVTADVRNFGSIFRFVFHGHDARLQACGACDHERIGIPPALEKLLFSIIC